MVDAVHRVERAPVQQAEKSGDLTIILSVGLALLAIGMIIACWAGVFSGEFDPTDMAQSLT